MRHSRLVFVILGLVGGFGGAALGRAPAYPEAPPAAHTGGFGEPTCQRCHFDLPLNDPGGTLTLGGVTEGYSAGQRYLLTVELFRPGMRRSGFQVSARFAEGARVGRQAGLFQPVDARTRITQGDSSAVHYAHHTKTGTLLTAPDTTRWTVVWTAPEVAGGRVVFHLAANAANDDASEFGDYIYATEWLARSKKRRE